MSGLPEIANRVYSRARILGAWLGLSALLSACNNSCFVGVINPPNNSLTITGGNTVCTLAPAKTTVKAALRLAPICADCSTTRQVTHVHLVLSGIELHPGAVADENSLQWQELAPDWESHPYEVDLAAEATNHDVALPLGAAPGIPAGNYYQLRLRIAPPDGEQAEQLRRSNQCVVANCLETADGSVHALLALDGHSYLLLQVATPVDLRADERNQLRMELGADWALHGSSSGVLESAPVLRGRVVDEPAPASAISF